MSDTAGVASSHSAPSASTTIVLPNRQSRQASHSPISAKRIGPAGGSARAVSSFSAYSMAVIMAERLVGWLAGWLVGWLTGWLVVVGLVGGGSGADGLGGNRGRRPLPQKSGSSLAGQAPTPVSGPGSRLPG